jgi:diguanylate cyclase (GGDEF)-like protein/PAS domain S-box-containing protein
MKPVCPELEKSIYRLFEITPTPTILSFPDGKLEYVNPALDELLGYKDDEVFADDVIITHPDDIEVSQFVRASLKSDPFTPVRIEKKYLHKNGHAVYCLLTMVAEPNEDGSVRRYIAQLMDLSAVKQAEATEVLLNHLIELSSDAIYVIDSETGHILNCNHLAYRILGYTKQELLNLTVGDINHDLGDPEKWQQHAEEIKRQSTLVIEFEHTCKNGDKLPIESCVSSTEYNNKVYFLAVCRDITQRKVKESKVLALINLDPLTRLPNRRVLDRKLSEIDSATSDENTLTAVIYLDLDNFKKINDSYGHAIGDAVLVGVANRLRKCVRKSDLIVRLGGDEFLIVSNGFKDEEQIESLADNILDEFGSPFTVGNSILKVDISIGISVNIDNNFDTETLIQCADEAMYVAKEKAGSARHYHQTE